MSGPPPLPGTWSRPGLHGYGRHVGPLWREAATGDLALRVEPRHTNATGRLHGGMAMSLAAIALAQAAQRAAESVRAGGTAVLLTQQCELIDSVHAAGWVRARTTVTRVTRTLVFLTGGLYAGEGESERPLMSMSAVFQIVAEAPSPARAAGPPPTPPAGYGLREPVDAFSTHVSPLYERRDEHGESRGAFHVAPEHLDARGGDQIDTGMLLIVADLFLGRRARVTSNAICVTVGMGVSRLAPVRQADLVECESRLEGQNGDTLVVTGHFRVRGTPVMSITSLWKRVSPHNNP